MATATSRDGKRKITAFQFPGAVVNSEVDVEDADVGTEGTIGPMALGRWHWAEAHPKVTWMETQTSQHSEQDSDKLPDLIQIDGD